MVVKKIRNLWLAGRILEIFKMNDFCTNQAVG